MTSGCEYGIFLFIFNCLNKTYPRGFSGRRRPRPGFVQNLNTVSPAQRALRT